MCVCVKWKNARRNGSISGISILGESQKKVERRVAERLGVNTWESCHSWNPRYKRGTLLPTWTTSTRQK